MDRYTAVSAELPDDIVDRVGVDFIDAVLAVKVREARVLIEKQAAYGPYNIARPPHGISPQVALTVRCNDKVQRLGTLLSADDATPAGSESRADSWGDLANYGSIGTMVEEGTWPGLDRPIGRAFDDHFRTGPTAEQWVDGPELPGKYPADMEEGAPERDPLDRYRWTYPAFSSP